MRMLTRLLARNPLSMLAALAALALAIGASTLVFSVVNGVLLRALPYHDPDRLVVVWETNPGRGQMENVASPGNFLYWRDRNHSFADMAAVGLTFSLAALAPGQPPEQVPAQLVSASLFPTLGVDAALGRVFTGDEDVPDSRVLVISHRYWLTRCGGDPGVLGRALVVEGVPRTVLGVMPPGFSLPDPDVDLWVPVGFSEASRTPRGRWLVPVARLASGATIRSAQSDMTAIAGELSKKFPAFDTGWSARVVPLHEQVTGRIRPALLLLLGAVGCVLLVACANVANLLLAGGAARRRELAVRAALGASRARLVGQLVGEALLLSGAGGGAGWVLATLGLRAIRSAVTDAATVPRLAEVSLDPRVLAFAALLSVAAALATGLFPAVAATRLGLVDAIRDGARGATSAAGARLRPTLVALEVALAVVLVAGAGLLVRSLIRLLDVNPGFTTEHVVTARVSLAGDRYERPEARTAFYDEVIRRIDRRPGVEAAGAISFLPMTGLASATSFTVVGQPPPGPGREPVAEVRIVAGDYFGTMGIPLVRGRLFQSTDTGDRAHVVVVSRALADAVFPGQDPIGHELLISWDSDVPDRIVGVVGDVHHASLDVPTRPMTYWPHARFANDFMRVVVKSEEPLETLGPALERAVHGLDPTVPVSGLRRMTDVVAGTVATRRLVMTLLVVFAGLALVLAALGIYAVMTCAVTERRNELAIRSALGAPPGRILRLVMGEALVTASVGAAAGLLAALALGRIIEGLLFQVGPADPWTLSAAVLGLIAVAVAASALPGRAAVRVDPIEALRAE